MDRQPRTLGEEAELLKRKIVIVATPILSRVLYWINRAWERRDTR